MPSALQAPTLFVLILAASTVSAHMWLQCPEPRQCFYESPLSSNNGDGEWRTKPCPFNPNPDHVTYLFRNETFCLRVSEFVDHHGWIDVNIAGVSVSPGDDQNLFDTQLAYIEDAQNGTSYQQIPITIPTNATCDGTCTIQVRQWSDDLNWFYYACSDVVILDRADVTNATKMLEMGIAKSDLTAEATCQSRIASNDCAWESGPMLLRIMILQLILLTIAPVLLVVAIPVICLFAFCRRSRTQTVDDSNDLGMNNTPTTEPQTDASVKKSDEGGKQPPPTTCKWWRVALIPVGVAVAIVILYLIIVGIVISQLKQCNYSGARTTELSK